MAGGLRPFFHQLPKSLALDVQGPAAGPGDRPARFAGIEDPGMRLQEGGGGRSLVNGGTDMMRCACLCAALAAAGLARGGGTNAPARPPPPAAAVRAVDPLGIRLPDMDFRQAPVVEIVDWIREESAKADPAGIGLSVVLKDDARGTIAATRLTLGLTRPTVQRALDLLATSANLYIRRDARAVVIEPSKAVIGR